MLTSSRKVAAAWKVSAVCLANVSTYPTSTIQEFDLLRDLVCLYSSVGSLKCLQSKILNICLSSRIVDNRIVGSIFGFDLGNANISRCELRDSLYTIPSRVCPSNWWCN